MSSWIDPLCARDAPERLSFICQHLKGKAVFTTSFGLEDQALTHMIFSRALPIEVVTLDTGRLFPETYELWMRTETLYGVRIRAFFPAAEQIEGYVAQHGINGFRKSVALRTSCCFIRKVEPLSRALEGASGWITGLRSGQSANRAAVPFAEEDSGNRLVKFNPLADWSRDQLGSYLKALDIPYNPLHDQGYPSIGCAPCTRAVRVGEDERAGRWWWESENRKECGLHVKPAPHSFEGNAI